MVGRFFSCFGWGFLEASWGSWTWVLSRSSSIDVLSGTSLGVVHGLVGTPMAGVVLAPEFPFVVGELCCLDIYVFLVDRLVVFIFVVLFLVPVDFAVGMFFVAIRQQLLCSQFGSVFRHLSPLLYHLY